jgi:ssDNA-specific exonuclease RecJ
VVKRHTPKSDFCHLKGFTIKKGVLWVNRSPKKKEIRKNQKRNRKKPRKWKTVNRAALLHLKT